MSGVSQGSALKRTSVAAAISGNRMVLVNMRKLYASKWKSLIVPAILVVLLEVGTAVVFWTARRDAPIGFWVWFGLIALLAPAVGFWLSRRLHRRKR